jgi:hypothetical protein
MYGSDDSLLEKRCNLGWLFGTFSTQMAPIKITFQRKNGALNVLITNYPAFSGALKE